NTNASVGWADTDDWNLFISQPCQAILEVMTAMRNEGKKTPYMVFWSSVSDDKGWSVMDKTYADFYANEAYKDCFVYWEGKPLALSTATIANPPPAFAVRKMWRLNQQPT